MRGKATLLASLTLVWAAHEVQSLQFESHPAFRIIGGSIEDPPQASTGHNDNDSPDATDSNAAFVGSAVTDARTTSQGGDGVKDRLNKLKRSSLNIGLNSEAMEKIKTQSSRVFTSLGPAAIFFRHLFFQTNGMLTKPAVYALALLGSSFGFHLSFYIVTVGYACGVTVPVLVAMILHNFKARGKTPLLTNIQSGLVVIWGIRSVWFFWFREYANEPQLDNKVREIDKLARTIPKSMYVNCVWHQLLERFVEADKLERIVSRIIFWSNWLVESIVYTAMSTPFYVA